ncbi:hypothetical protein D9M68_580400 [compost metagenome]
MPKEHQLVALLHDAPEAYIGDMVRPLKMGLRERSSTAGVESLYHTVEHRIWLAICERFGVDPEIPACVKEADMIALATERRELLPNHPAAWECLAGVEPLPHGIELWTPEHARQVYHDRLMDLLATTHRANAA